MFEEPESVPLEKDNGMVHFSKINIFGDTGVGKSSLISWLKNYTNENYKLQKDANNDSFVITRNLVEQVEKVVIPLNENKNMRFLLYETKVNYFDLIKVNLDTLLFQTECIILMWDNSNASTFDIIPDLIKSINSIESIVNNKINIFIIQNKTDLKFDDEKISEREIEQEIDKLKEINENIIIRKMQLLNRNDLQNLLNDINGCLAQNKNNNLNDDNSIKLPYPMKEINEKDIITNINICLLGDSQTGLKTFIRKLIEVDENKNIKEELNYLISVNDEKIYLKINYASKHKNKALFDMLYKKCHGFLLFYDVTSQNSFKFIEDKAKKITDDVNGNIIIVANKIDEKEARIIPKSEGQNLAKNLNCEYYECSGISGINVYEIFNRIISLSYYVFKRNIKRSLSFSIKENKSDNENKSKQGCC